MATKRAERRGGGQRAGHEEEVLVRAWMGKTRTEVEVVATGTCYVI